MGCIKFSTLTTTCLLLALVVGNNAGESEVEDEHPFSYSVNTAKGPENWGQLDPKWDVCKNGKFQSPIDIPTAKVNHSSELDELKISYKPTPAMLKNRGHDIQISFNETAGGVFTNGTQYTLQQMHWHTPSEHTINGKRFDMEMHLVHNNSEGGIAVVAILYKLGSPDLLLGKILAEIKNATEDGIPLGFVDPMDIHIASKNYFRYVGSLTVPPCTENVLWTVSTRVMTVTVEQKRALRDAVHDGFEDNFRPTQPLHERTVQIYP